MARGSKDIKKINKMTAPIGMYRIGYMPMG